MSSNSDSHLTRHELMLCSDMKVNETQFGSQCMPISCDLNKDFLCSVIHIFAHTFYWKLLELFLLSFR